MKIARVRLNNEDFYVRVEGETLIRLIGEPYEGIIPDNRQYSISDVELLCPCEPTKIVAVGLNYLGHGDELGMSQPADPILFLKPTSAIIAHNRQIIRPPQSNRVDYEAELGVVISKKCRNITADEAKDYILGYTCVNDVTARDIQSMDGQWTRAKSFDTFAPVGPWIETELDENSLEIEARINGETVQHSNTSRMIFSPTQLVAFISQVMTLNPGDLIATGTPKGVGEIPKDAKCEIYISGIGSLINPCK
jgi:2-keto-4-pentenoate hydratase/2-oxohepta-3-ene-1,7-dioic acid hydratase in catechol pathway